MQRRFEIRISNRPRPGSDSELPSAGPTSRIKNFVFALTALALVAAALIVGVIVGTAVAVTIGVLVLVALAVLIVRGSLRRGRPHQ
jgi:Flp pilus assembly protein TadB